MMPCVRGTPRVQSMGLLLNSGYSTQIQGTVQLYNAQTSMHNGHADVDPWSGCRDHSMSVSMRKGSRTLWPAHTVWYPGLVTLSQSHTHKNPGTPESGVRERRMERHARPQTAERHGSQTARRQPRRCRRTHAHTSCLVRASADGDASHSQRTTRSRFKRFQGPRAHSE